MVTAPDSISWAELAGLTLARQFPDADSPAELMGKIGPIQSQAARAPFLGICARSAAADHASITAAYERFALVRGSAIRGTVHTCAAEHHPILDVLTRLGIGTRWRQYLHLQRGTPEELWHSVEDFGRETWRTPAELREHLIAWLIATEGPEAGVLSDVGRYLAFGHGGLIRRPLKGGWEGQGAPVYRTAAAVLGDRADWLADPDRTLQEGIRLHLRSHGPASRHDLAWWSGIALGRIDAALVVLAGELRTRRGPDGRDYHDLVELPETGRELPGIRLLPEFDALLCGYDPPGRMRFVDPDRHAVLMSRANGLIRPPLLVDGRITGYWRLNGSGRTRALEVVWFPGTRRPPVAEVRRAAESVTRALPVQLSEVQVAAHRD